MIAYTIRRLLTIIVQLSAMLLGTFLLLRWLPTDPVARLAGSLATPAMMEQTRQELNLDLPWYEQLSVYLGLTSSRGSRGLLQGEWGTSWVTGSDIGGEVWARLAITLEWVSLSFLLTALIAIPLGMWAAFRSRGLAGRLISGMSLFSGAQAGFWWGLMLIYVFFVTLRIAPAPTGHLDPLTLPIPRTTGFMTLDALLAGRLDAAVEVLAHLALPVVSLMIIIAGPVLKMVYSCTLTTLESDFVLYARACGLHRAILNRYVLRNSVAPTLTLLGLLYGIMISGAVTMETVFSLGGIGEYAVSAVLNFDYQAIQGVVVATTATALLAYLALDLVHAWVDPRIRIRGEG